MRHTYLKLILIGLGLSSLNACHYLSYTRSQVQQGTLLKAETVKKLKIGMQKTDAAIILGTSLITPTFQKNRWDYAFTIQKNDGPILLKHLSLYFENNRLVRIVKAP